MACLIRKLFAIANHDTAVIHIQMWTRRREKNQVAGLNTGGNFPEPAFGNAGEALVLAEEGRKPYSAGVALILTLPELQLLHKTGADIVSDPVCHVVISTLPVDAAGLIADAAKKRSIVFCIAGVGTSNDGLHISDTIKSAAYAIDACDEYLGGIGRSDQWICNIRAAQELAGNRIDSNRHGLRTLHLARF